MSQIVVSIAADADDGREGAGAWVSTSIIIGFGSVQRNAGLRFTGITIPAGATIDSAKLTVREVNYDTGGSFTTTIAGWKTNNPPVFDGTHLPSAQPQTTATVPWTFDSAANLNTNFDSPDIKGIVQENLDAYGLNNSSLAFMVLGSGSGNDAYLEDFNAAAGNAAILTVNYTVSGRSWILGRH